MERKDENMDHPLTDYISASEAAHLLSITPNRVYEIIDEGRLRGRKIGKIYYILRSDVENFKRRPTGRRRTKAVQWRGFTGDVRLMVTMIDVRIHPGQQEGLRDKLVAIRQNQRHLFPGTMARYIMPGEQLDTLTIWLVWKDSDMPTSAKREQLLQQFKEETAQTLDWETARVRVNLSPLHT
jgi:excisionase family DNA binding protein